MGVEIDQPRNNDEAFGIDRFDVARFDPLVDARDHAVFDQDVELRIELLAGIDDAAVLDEEVHALEAMLNVQC